MFNYRGYAYSDEATPSEEGIKTDAQAMLDWCIENKTLLNNKIVLFGRSFGAAVALYMLTELCSKDGVSA